MIVKNQFGIEPGIWKSNEGVIVVTTIQTHALVNGVIEELPDPIVICRDLTISIEKHSAYGIKLSEFKKIFKKD